MTDRPNLLFTLPVVVMSRPDATVCFTVRAGERVLMFARGVKVRSGPLLDPGDYEVSGHIIAGENALFPICIAMVQRLHIGAFLGLDQESIDGVMDVIEQAITTEAERSRPN